MIKLSALVLDIYDDETGAIATALPPDMHQVKVADADLVQDLPDHQFGLVFRTASGDLRRRFPLHDADALKLSEAYFTRTGSVLPPEVQTQVAKKFAAVKADPHDTSVVVVDMAKTAAAVSEEIFPDRVYGLVLGDQHKFPLHTPELTKVAITRFPFTTETMEPAHRFLYARNIEKRASQLKVEIPCSSEIWNYTGTVLNKDSLKLALDQRRTKLASVGARTDIIDQLELAAGITPYPGEMEHPDSVQLRQAKAASVPQVPVEQVLTVLCQIDKITGETYSRHYMDPFAACFKAAAYPTASASVDGVDLGAIPAEALAKQFDESFVKEFLADPVRVYMSLPTPVQAVLRKMAGGNTTPSTSLRSPGGSGEPMTRLNPDFMAQGGGLSLG